MLLSAVEQFIFAIKGWGMCPELCSKGDSKGTCQVDVLRTVS